MSSLITLLLFLLLLSVIIVIHEFGHLMAAKLFHVFCYEFSFGMGPLIWKRKTGETQYSIRAVPMGGFVAMAGEADGDEAYPDVIVPEGRRLQDVHPLKKIVIMLAGVFNNFLLAWLLFSMVVLHSGQIQVSPKPVVSSVVAGTPAAKAGFEAGDVITKIVREDGSSVKPRSFLDMQAFIAQGEGDLTFYVDRDGESVVLEVTPEFNAEEQAWRIGITGTAADAVDVTLANCWYYGAYEMVTITRVMFTTIAGLFHGSGVEQLSGPVGIYQATETYASMGFWSYLFLIAQLSLNVGIFNLLPLPILDGGQVVVTVCEWIAHRQLSAKVKLAINAACWVLMLSLMVFVTWNDIARLLGIG